MYPIRGQPAKTKEVTGRIQIGYDCLMTLEERLVKREMNNAEFAQVSGIGQRALVQKYRCGRQFPGFDNLQRIMAATHGAVTANDFVD
jgi:hypothetical protein